MGTNRTIAACLVCSHACSDQSLQITASLLTAIWHLPACLEMQSPCIVHLPCDCSTMRLAILGNGHQLTACPSRLETAGPPATSEEQNQRQHRHKLRPSLATQVWAYQSRRPPTLWMTVMRTFICMRLVQGTQAKGALHSLKGRACGKSPASSPTQARTWSLRLSICMLIST